MTDTTTGQNQAAAPAPEPVAPASQPAAPSAPTLAPHRPWHHDHAAVAVLALVGGFFVVALAFGMGWHARGVSERVFGGPGFAAHGFAGPGMMGGGYGMMRGERGYEQRFEGGAPYDRGGCRGWDRYESGRPQGGVPAPQDPATPQAPYAPQNGWNR